MGPSPTRDVHFVQVRTLAEGHEAGTGPAGDGPIGLLRCVPADAGGCTPTDTECVR
jgi:hypothetical protein